jgi:hypothetical protein
MFFMYILRSDKTGRLYTGHTSDLSRRLAEHNSGMTTRLAMVPRGNFYISKPSRFVPKQWSASATSKRVRGVMK